MRKLHLILATLLIICSASAQDSVQRVISESLKPSSLDTNLQTLTDQIGGRVPGTPEMQKAVDWGMAAFKAAGADSVHTEQFTLSAGWSEGATQMSVVAPQPFRVRALSFGWAPALAPHKRVPVIDVGAGNSDDFNKPGIAGSIALVHSEEMHKWEDLFGEYLRGPVIVDRAVKAKALAIAFQSTRPHDLLYRHTNSVAGEIDPTPIVLVAREDAARIARLLASGQKLYADISIPNKITGPITAANVVAEIKGSEKPDEYVILGAHLDSWELGTGALDNGCNGALVIDALRAIKAAGVRPRRSMRFVLFSGEEQGMVGSRAYADAHRDELDKIAGVVVVDSGSGRITGFSTGGRKEIAPEVEKLISALKEVDMLAVSNDPEWGTDNFDFMLQGVPTFVADQEESNYLINYHAESDTFDKVDIPQLHKHVAEAAALSFELADLPEKIGPRIHRAQIEQMMRETHFDDQLKSFGVWKEWESGKRGRKD
jgi:carboxypeptidase Q